MAEIKGKYAIITGASRGIGREIATALAREGVDLLLVSRTGEALISLCDELKEYSRVSYFVADLSDSGQMKKLFTHARKNEIKPDILIHSAGQFFHAEIIDTLEEDLDLAYKVNFKAPFLITRHFLPDIIANQGSIVFINSTATLNPKKQSTLYSTTKSALKTFADVLHKEVHPKGVRIINIFPGRVDTEMQQLATNLEGVEYQPSSYLNPKDIADSIVYNLKLSPEIDIYEIVIRPAIKPDIP